MKNKVLNSIINLIKKHNNYNEIKLQEIRYGLETLYLSILKFIIIFFTSFFIHTTKYLCLFLLTYGLLRITGFGLHTKNSIQCWILSIITFSMFPLLIKYLNINSIYLYFISILLLLFIIKYTPADTEKRPLINKNKRLIFKIATSLIVVSYIVIMLIAKTIIIKKLLFFSILLEVLLILPISYKLLGLKYNNYLLYKRKEVNNETIS